MLLGSGSVQSQFFERPTTTVSPEIATDWPKLPTTPELEGLR